MSTANNEAASRKSDENPGLADSVRNNLKGMSLHSFMTRLIWLCVVPLVFLTLYLAVSHIRILQTQQKLDAEDRVSNVANALDSNLSARIKALQVLAASPLVDDSSRLQAFYREAQGFRESFGGHVILADPSMQMLFNTRTPLGASLPKLPQPKGHAAAPAALETGKPAVGDMFLGPIAKEPLIAVVVPVLRDGQTRALLLSIVETHQFQQSLEAMALPDGWSLTVLDGKNEVMARRLPKDMGGDSSTTEPAGRFVATLAFAPWSVALGISADTYRESIVSSAAGLSATILAVTLVSVLGGRLASRRLARSVVTLTGIPSSDISVPVISEFEAVRAILNDAKAARDASENALRDSEARFRATFEQAAVGMAQVAPDGRWLHMNQRLCAIVGYTRDELLGMAFQEITHPEDLEADLDNVRQVLADEVKSYSMEKRYLRKDGSAVWTNLTVSLLRDETGQPKYFVSVVEDITDRRQAEESLRYHQHLLQQMGRVAKIGGWEFNPLTDTWTWTEEVARIHGLEPRDGGIAGHGTSFHHGKACTKIESVVKETVAGGKPFDLELEMSAPTGIHKWVHTIGYPVIEKGEVVRVRGSFQDITERKRADAEIFTLNDRLHQLISAIKELSSAHSLEIVQRIVATSARKLTGADGATMVFREGDFCFYADEDAIGPLWKGQKFPLTSCISGWVMLNSTPAIISDIYADERIPVEAYKPTFVKSLAMIPVRTTEPVAAIGNYWRDNHHPSEMEIQLLQTLADAAARAVENVRLLNELEDRVRERTAQLEAANRELESFSYSVSHDLKAPLRGIDGFSRILEEDYRDRLDAEGRRFLQNIRRGTAQMNQLIEDLLAYSRMERRSLQGASLDLSAMVQDVLAERMAEIEQSGVLLRPQLPEVTVFADREGLLIVLRNLLENAIKFSRDAQSPTIDIGARSEGGKTVLWVRDNGIGFDMKFHDRIFDMFQRLQRAEDYPGTGIGLALVRKAMQRMDGRVWAESSPGAGATFFLELPQ